MMYEEFVNDFIEGLQQELGPDVQLMRAKHRKVNEELDGVTVKYPDSDVAPTLYLEEKYELIKDGLSTEELVRKTAEQLRRLKEQAPEVPTLTEEEARKNLYCVVVNAAKNEELLRNVPHEQMEDLAILPRFRVGDEASFIVSKEMCERLSMTSEEVLEAAHKNTDKQLFECKNMAEVIGDIMREQGMPEEYVEELVEAQGVNCPMYVVTNEAKVDGAAALLSEKAMEAAYQMIKAEHPDMKDLYVIGSSRHELILVPDEIVKSPDDLRAIHNEVQSTELRDADKLTDHIYKLDANTKHIVIADEPTRSNTESVSMDVSKSHGRSH